MISLFHKTLLARGPCTPYGSPVKAIPLPPPSLKHILKMIDKIEFFPYHRPNTAGKSRASKRKLGIGRCSFRKYHI